MRNKYKYLIAGVAALATFFGLYINASATSTFITQQGGTGSTSPSGILYGDNGATNHVNTVTVGTGLSFSGGTLSATNAGTVTSVTGVYPILSTGGATPAISIAFGTSTSNTWGGTQTFSNAIVVSNFTGTINANGGTTYVTATSTPTVTAPITYSGTLGQFIGGVSGTFACTSASAGVTGCLPGADWSMFNNKQSPGFQITTTSPISVSNLAYFTGTTPTSLGGVATTSESITGPFTIPATYGKLVGGSGSITYYGLATTSSISQGQILYGTSALGVASAATTSLSITGPFSIANPIGVINNGAIIYSGLATTSAISSSQVLYGTSASGVASVGTSSIANGTNITVTNGGTAFVLGAQPTINLSGVIAYANGGTGTTTAPQGQLLYGGASAYQSIATTSASCSGTVSCTGFTVIGASPITITGSGSGGSFPFAADTNYGVQVYSTSTPTLWFKSGVYASSTSAFNQIQVGSTSPSTNSNAPLVVSGNQNGIVQSVFRNSNNGNNASSNVIIENDKSTDSTYYTELGQNSSGYSQVAFSSQNPGDSYLDSSDNALVVGTASSTNPFADLRFVVGGTASSSIRAMFFVNGRNTIGTTTAQLGEVTIGTSTAGVPQLVLSDNSAGDFNWFFRTSGNALTIGTSTTATSSVSALSISPNSVVSIGNLSTGFVQSSASGALSSAALTSGQVTTALGFTPFGGTNPLPIANGGTATTTGGNTNTIEYYNGTTLTNSPILKFDGSQLTIGTTTSLAGQQILSASSTAQQLVLSSGVAGSAAWAFRTLSDGSFNLGTTTGAGATNTPSALQISSQTSTQVGIATSSPWRTLSVTGTVGFDGLSAAAAGTIIVCIDSTTKELKLGGGSTTCAPSSIRYKKDVATSTVGIDELMKLTPVSFYFKQGEKQQQLGFIAEEVQKIDPRLVQLGTDGLPQTLRLDNFISLIVSTLQQVINKQNSQEIRIQELEQEVATLENNNTTICVFHP